jgi:hypothetical protein
VLRPADALRRAGWLRQRRDDRGRHLRRPAADRAHLDGRTPTRHDQHAHDDDEYHPQQLRVEQLVELRLLGLEREQRLGFGLRRRQPVEQHGRLQRDRGIH